MSHPSTEKLDAALVERLRAAGCVFAEDEARLLVSAARDAAELERLVRLRVEGSPLEQVLGWAEFCGLRILVQPGVFVPRRRTEFLAEQALRCALHRGRPVVLDLCCGSGAIATVIGRLSDDADVYAADVDPTAAACARRNLGERGRVFAGDLFAPLPSALRGGIDVLVVNAPYVPTEHLSTLPPEARLHEPPVALDGGDDGLRLHRRIAAEAPAWLAPGADLLIECSQGQAPTLARILTEQGFSVSTVHREETDSTVVIGGLRDLGDRSAG